LAGVSGDFQYHKAVCLASKAYNVLDLKYFGETNLSENHKDVPLEYLYDAINWLKINQQLISQKLLLLVHLKAQSMHRYMP
jgi:hypothetical protein